MDDSEAADDSVFAMATAKQYQQQAQECLRDLRSLAEALPGILREAVRRAHVEGVSHLQAELDKTTRALKSLGHRTRWNLLWITPLACGLGLAVGLTAGTWHSEVSPALRPDTADSRSAHGAAAGLPLAQCRDARHPPHACVRVDVASGPFGPHQDYYLLATPERRP